MRAQTFRQILVMAGLAVCSVSDGFIFGQMSGMIDALQSKDNSIWLTDDDLSWIASIINVTCFCGFGWMTILTEIFGRRRSFTILSIPVILSWIMVYLAQDKITLLLSRVIVGMSFGGILLLTYVSVGEYVAPNMRPLCLNVVSSVASAAGTMLGHILSIFFHWRQVALIGLVPSTLSALLPLFWVESPSWLAHKGRFEECERAFNSLHSPSEATDKELRSLLHAQRGINVAKDSNSLLLLLRKFLEASKKKYFWKLVQLQFVIAVYRVAAGRVLFNTFALTILQDIADSPDILNFTVLVDLFSVLGTSLSCVLVSKLYLRNLLFTSGIVANVVQTVLAACLYFWPHAGNFAVWSQASLLALYFITVNAGPYAVIETLLSELFPLDIKTLLMLLMGMSCGVMQFLSIKFALYAASIVGYHGIFLINVLLIFMCLTYLYFYLPETKGRTLQEIEYYFKNDKFEVVDDSPNPQPERELLHIEQKL